MGEGGRDRERKKGEEGVREIEKGRGKERESEKDRGRDGGERNKREGVKVRVRKRGFYPH